MGRCVVLVPYLTHVEPACERGLRDAERAGLEVRRYQATAAIDRTRCEAATAALHDGFDELMWIDSDISFELADLERLRAHELPIAGGVYAKKGTQALALHALPGTRELRLGDGGGPLAVRYVGAGFLLTRRHVYDDIQRFFTLPICNTRFGMPSVPYFLPMVVAEPGGHWYLGEDYSFCERARQAGHATVVDTAIRLGHVGSYAYGWEDAAQAIPRVTGVTFHLRDE
jgi:hypothetical protein